MFNTILSLTFAIFFLYNCNSVSPQTIDTYNVSDATTASYGSRNLTKFLAYQILRTEMNGRLKARQKAPPKYYQSHNSNIAISFEPLQIIDVVGMTQAMTLTSIVTLTWRDPEVMWDPSMYAGITDIQLATDNLWTPSVIVPKSSDNDDLNIEFPEIVGITYNGIIAAVIPTFITTLCTLDMTYFPFDDHNCTVVFLESSFYNMTSFTAPPTDIQSHFGTHGEWVMYQHWCYSNVSHMDPVFVYVTCYIAMRRCSLFFVLNLIGPMAMTSVMTLLVFWIPAKSGEKIGYVLSMYTSTSVFLSFIVERIPKNMDRTLPRINILLLAIVIQVILATAATALVLKRYKKELDVKKMAKTKKSSKESSGTQNVVSKNETMKTSNIEVSTKQKVKSTNEVTTGKVHIIYTDNIHTNDSMDCVKNTDIHKKSDSTHPKVNHTSGEKEVVKKETIQLEAGSNTCGPSSPGTDQQNICKCMTHDELDKLFFAILSTMTVVMYIVVYIY